MFKLNIFRYTNYIINSIKISKKINSKNQIIKLKNQYKKIILNFCYFKKQKINKYKINKIYKKKYIQNIIIYKNNLFFWRIYNNFYIKNIFTKNETQKLQIYINKFKFIINNDYWFNFIYINKINIKKFYFINKIKFFSNQRLIKQPILIQYSNLNKKNTYSNFRPLLKNCIDKNNNFLFFFKIKNIYLKNTNYFYKYNLYLKNYIYKNNILLLLK